MEDDTQINLSMNTYSQQVSTKMFDFTMYLQSLFYSYMLLFSHIKQLI